MRRYAEDTAVPVSKSRGEIDALLREWVADGVQWTDDWQRGRVRLKFVWGADGKKFNAHFSIALRSEKEIRADDAMRDQRIGSISEAKVARALAAIGKSDHRLLLLWLKASFNAVDAGLVSAEALFLPFLEWRDGRTVAEVAVPHLERLLTADASRLLGAGDGR